MRKLKEKTIPTMVTGHLNSKGEEILDSTPMAVPIGYSHPEDLQTKMRRIVKNEMSMQAQNNDQESFDEADDFDIGDDFEPKSPYENDFDPEMEKTDGNFKEEKPPEDPPSDPMPPKGNNGDPKDPQKLADPEGTAPPKVDK